jgi:hypothetical protein
MKHWEAAVVLGAIIAGPFAIGLVAMLLIDLLTRVPLLIIGGLLLVGGAFVWALCRAAATPLKLDDDDVGVYRPMYGSRFRRR